MDNSYETSLCDEIRVCVPVTLYFKVNHTTRSTTSGDPLRLISLFVMSSVKPVRSVHGEESMLVFKAIWTAFTILPLYGALSQYGAVQRVFHCDLIRFYTGFMGILYNLH